MLLLVDYLTKCDLDHHFEQHPDWISQFFLDVDECEIEFFHRVPQLLQRSRYFDAAMVDILFILQSCNPFLHQSPAPSDRIYQAVPCIPHRIFFCPSTRSELASNHSTNQQSHSCSRWIVSATSDWQIIPGLRSIQTWIQEVPSLSLSLLAKSNHIGVNNYVGDINDDPKHLKKQKTSNSDSAAATFFWSQSLTWSIISWFHELAFQLLWRSSVLQRIRWIA